MLLIDKSINIEHTFIINSVLPSSGRLTEFKTNPNAQLFLNDRRTVHKPDFKTANQSTFL